MAYDLEAAIEAAVERGVRRVLEGLKPAEGVQAELLTTAQAAKLANVSVETIRRWLEDGNLTRYGSAHAVRVRKDELLNLKPKGPGPEKSTHERVLELLAPRSR